MKIQTQVLSRFGDERVIFADEEAVDGGVEGGQHRTERQAAGEAAEDAGEVEGQESYTGCAGELWCAIHAPKAWAGMGHPADGVGAQISKSRCGAHGAAAPGARLGRVGGADSLRE